MQIVVAGGTGFVGRHLVPELLAHGHDVRVMTRHPHPRADGAVEIGADVADAGAVAAAVDGCDVAVYLVHTLDKADFVARDREGATVFAEAAARGGLRRVVYLGGLGEDDDVLSPHLRSRREVEQIFTRTCPTIALRAGIVIGDGSVSWEILCQLVERLPVMVTPRWVQTRTAPIAIDDIVRYLAAAVELSTDVVPHSDHFEVGVREALTYRQMLEAVAAATDRTLRILPVPLLSPGLSSHWLRLITDVDLQTARSLVDSMTNEVVVTDRRMETLSRHAPTPFAEAMRRALDARRVRLDGAHHQRTSRAAG